MFLAILLGIVVAIPLGFAILLPPRHWNDTGDVSGIVQHSIRVPSDIERLAMWYSRYYLIVEQRNV